MLKISYSTILSGENTSLKDPMRRDCINSVDLLSTELLSDVFVSLTETLSSSWDFNMIVASFSKYAPATLKKKEFLMLDKSAGR